GLGAVNVRLGSGGNAFAVDDVDPATDVSIDGGTSAKDSVAVTSSGDFDGHLDLTAFEHGTVTVNGEFDGQLSDTAPGPLERVKIVGSLTPTGRITAGDLASLTIGPDGLGLGKDLAGVVTVAGTLGSARVAGGTPGSIVAGHVGTVSAYGGS